MRIIIDSLLSIVNESVYIAYPRLFTRTGSRRLLHGTARIKWSVRAYRRGPPRRSLKYNIARRWPRGERLRGRFSRTAGSRVPVIRAVFMVMHFTGPPSPYAPPPWIVNCTDDPLLVLRMIPGRFYLGHGE